MKVCTGVTRPKIVYYVYVCVAEHLVSSVCVGWARDIEDVLISRKTPAHCFDTVFDKLSKLQIINFNLL